MSTVTKLFVRDDLGMLWLWDEDEHEIVLEGDDSPGAGYPATSFEDAVAQLIEYGYLTLEGA